VVFYDRQNLFFKNVKDSVILAACSPPGGGRNEITPRLTRHFHLLNYPSLDHDQMTHIFTTILSSFFEHYQFSQTITTMVPHIVKSSIEVYEELKKELLPKPSTSHYTFNLRDLAKLFQGILQVRSLQVTDRETLAKLWIHEGARVFRDRLIHDSDISWSTHYKDKCWNNTSNCPGKKANLKEYCSEIMNREDKLYEEILRKPLAAWFNDLCERTKFINSWIIDGPPTVYWLSAFFFPQGFLTGVLQTHARKHRIAIDQLHFKTKVCSKKIKTPPESGVYVRGLFMEGARWDTENASIEESKKGDLFTSMPPLWLQPVIDAHVEEEGETKGSARGGTKKRRDSKKEDEKHLELYNCPVYKTAERAGSLSTTGISTNFVLTVQLNCGKHDALHWTQRGVALLTMLDT
jgi:hypothetical protein